MPVIRPIKTLFRRLIRLWLWSGVVTLAVLAIYAHRAWARTEHVLGDFGRHLMKYADAAHQTEPSELLLNGASFFFSTGASESSVHDVLEHFHAACLKRGPQLHTLWQDPKLPPDLLKKAEAARETGILDGVVRVEGEETGVVACLDTGGEALDSLTLIRRIQGFVETGDASVVGDLRYVMVEKGQVHETTFVTAWTDGPLNLREMFPPEGDAPGMDIPDLPRPEGARRVLSSFQRDGDDLVTLYKAPLSTEDLHGFYVSALKKRGFSIDGGADQEGKFIIAHRGNTLLSLGLIEVDGAGLAIASSQAEVGLGEPPYGR